jgi:hypothetical protein
MNCHDNLRTSGIAGKTHSEVRQTSCIQPKHGGHGRQKRIEPRFEGVSQRLEARSQTETVAARGSNGVSGKQSTEVDDS